MRASRSASSAAVCTAAVSSAGLRPGRAARPVPPADSEGGTQLVAGVGDERAFGVKRAPEPAEQVVHGPGEGGDLVPGPGDLQDRRVAADTEIAAA